MPTPRSCRVCGRWLADFNKHPDLCFHHQTPPGELGAKLLRQRDAHETFVRSAAPVCSSREVRGFTRTAIDYDGDPRNA